MTLSECCMQIQPLDETAMQAAQQHWNQLAKPLHSLGRLEDMIVQLAGIHRSAQLEQRKNADYSVAYLVNTRKIRKEKVTAKLKM